MNAITKFLIAGALVFTITFASAQQSVTWTNVMFLNISGNYLEKVGNVQTAWNAGAISQQNVYGDGWVEFRFVNARYSVMGLSHHNTSVDPSSIDYGLFIHINANVYVYEKGVRLAVGPFSRLSTDVFRVERNNGIVYYKKNGTILYTSTIASSGPLHIDSSFNLANSAISVSNYMFGLIWTGAQSDDWNLPANWNLNRVPTAADQVTINSCTTCPRLKSEVDVTALFLNSGSKIDLENHILTVGTVSTLNGGNVESDQGKIRSTDFVEIKNCSFQGSIVLEKTGGAANICYGGNLFSPELKIVNSSGFIWQLAAQAKNEVKEF